MKIKTFIKLGDICDISAGQGAPQGDSNYCDNGTPFVKAGNLIELLQGKNETDIQKVSEDVAKKHKLKKYTAGSILFAKSGMSCMKGYVYQLKNDSYVVSHLAIVKPIKDSSDYIEYCLRHIKPNSLVKDEAYPSISLQDISNLKIPLPSLEEQIKISKQLYICTQIINKHKKQLERYDTLIKSRFIEMFGDKPVESGKWKVETLGSHLITIDNGKSFVCSDSIRKGEYPAILKLSAVTYGEYNQNENKALLDEDMFLKKVEVKQGDLLFTRKNTPELVGMAAYVFETERNLMMPDLIFRLNVKDDLNKIYLWKLINHPLFRERIQNLANGSAKSMSNISKERLQTLKIPVPPLALQNEFSSFVQQIDKSKFAVQKSLEKAETLYKSLMQRYFA